MDGVQHLLGGLWVDECRAVLLRQTPQVGVDEHPAQRAEVVGDGGQPRLSRILGHADEHGPGGDGSRQGQSKRVGLVLRLVEYLECLAQFLGQAPVTVNVNAGGSFRDLRQFA